MFNKPFFPDKNFDPYADLTHNAIELKKVKKIYNSVGGMYLGICLYTLIMSMSSILDPRVGRETLQLFIDGIVLNGLLLYYGFFACYKHNSAYALIAVVVQIARALVEFLFLMDVPHSVGHTMAAVIVLVVALSGLTIYANAKYTALEQLPGFPYFNQRHIDQEFDRTQREIKDEYTQFAENCKKTETDVMGDYTEDRSNGDISSRKSSVSGTMDSI